MSNRMKTCFAKTLLAAFLVLASIALLPDQSWASRDSPGAASSGDSEQTQNSTQQNPASSERKSAEVQNGASSASNTHLWEFTEFGRGGRRGS